MSDKLPKGWLPYVEGETRPSQGEIQEGVSYYLARDSESGLLGWVPYTSEPEQEAEPESRPIPSHLNVETIPENGSVDKLIIEEKAAWKKRKQTIRNKITRIRQHARQKERQLLPNELDEIASLKRELEQMAGHYTQQVAKSRLDVIDEKLDYIISLLETNKVASL